MSKDCPTVVEVNLQICKVRKRFGLHCRSCSVAFDGNCPEGRVGRQYGPVEVPSAIFGESVHDVPLPGSVPA